MKIGNNKGSAVLQNGHRFICIRTSENWQQKPGQAVSALSKTATSLCIYIYIKELMKSATNKAKNGHENIRNRQQARSRRSQKRPQIYIYIAHINRQQAMASPRVASDQ
jgi:hypothetical protein